ncbi:co-chaperone GroES family protein [Boseaceae bacterium BT-24-1]|nr:co-chaperone GroES family protein [Boseaceae bacterium BT-24-1]
MNAPVNLMRMKHDADPATALREAAGDLKGVELFHNQILVATYKRPERTAGGIILTDNTRKEDEYQGKVGLVLMKGPMAFKDDGHVHFHGQDVEPGDWISYRHSDGWALSVNGCHCRVLEDSHVRARVDNPDRIY